MATYPAGHKGVIGVSATDANDALPAFSNYGASIFLAAPGVNIAGPSIDGTYLSWSGTSASAAIVAGAAAQIRAVYPELSNGVIVGRLARNADEAGTQEQTGNGRLNMARALVDSSLEEVQPAGAPPTGNGGPFVGPYRIAKRNWSLTFVGTGAGSVTITPSTGSVNAPIACGGTESDAASQTVVSTCSPNISTDSNGATVTFTATAATGSAFAGWSGASNLTSSTCSGATNPCSAVIGSNGALTVTFNTKTKPSIAWSNPADIVYGSALSGTQLNATASVPGTFVYSPAAGTVLSAGVGQTLHVEFTPIDSSNYENAAQNVTIIVLQAASTTELSCPPSLTYTGSALEPCTAKVTGAGGLNQSLTVSYQNNTNAGTATTSASYSGDTNHTGSSDSKTFEILKAAVTATAGSGSATYDGSAKTPSTCTVTGAYTGDLSCTNSPTSVGPNAGTTPIVPVVSGTGQDNFDITVVNGSFRIEKAPSTAVVTCSAGPFTYSGSTINPCSATVTGAGDLNESLTVSYENNTDAGTATASASFTGDANHEASSGSTTFTIDKAPSTSVVTCGAGPFTYSGNTQTPCSANVTGAGGLNQSLDVSYVGNVDAGTATASASFAGDTNHTGSSDSESFTIDRAASVTAIICPTNATYTGTALTPCSANVTGAGGLGQTLTVSYSDNVNAGPTSASASYAGDANHYGSSGSGGFTIDKAPSTVTVTCPDSAIVTGSAITPCTAAYSGVGGLTGTLTPVYSNNINVGTAVATASYAGDLNHEGTTNSSTFKILYATGLCLGSAGHSILQPIDVGGTSVFKQKSTVPAKFRVCDANGRSVGTPGVVTSFKLTRVVSGTTVNSTNEEVASTTPDTAFRWSSTDQQWIFNISSKELTANKTYVYDIALNDGSTISFQFGLK